MREHEGKEGCWSVNGASTEPKKVGWGMELEQPSKKALSEDEGFLSRALDFSYSGIAVLDEKGVFQVYNPGMERIFGYTASEVPDFETWSKSVFPEPTLRAQVGEAFWADARPDSPLERVFPFIHKSKEKGWFRVHISLMSTRRIVVNVENITEHKRMELALKTSRDRLETIFAVVSNSLYVVDQGSLIPTLINQIAKLTRTETHVSGEEETQLIDAELKVHTEHLKELVEERIAELLKAERMAALGEAATMIAHDLRNPLQDIRLAQYLLRKRCPHEEKLLEQTDRCVAYADGIIENLLIYGGKRQLALQKTNLNQLLKETIQEFALPKHITIEEKRNELQSMYVDPTQMKRVFQNIISNAVQAMDNGGTLTTESKQVEGSSMISFQDTGVGIPEERLELIWRPFYTTKARGMGLGLSVAKQVVEAHGGTIGVKSKLGVGSTFTIEIPVQPRSMKTSDPLMG